MNPGAKLRGRRLLPRLAPGALLALLALASGCRGCDPGVDHFLLCTLSEVRGGPVATSGIRIRQGAAVAIKLTPFDAKGEIMDEDTLVTTHTTPGGILGVQKLHFESGGCTGPADAPWYFVIHGLAPGETVLYVHASGSRGAAIPVTVTAP